MLNSFFLVALNPNRKSALLLKYSKDAQSKSKKSPSEQSLCSFCFYQDSNSIQLKEFRASEEFVFTLTDGDGARMHGFCRSFLPPYVRGSTTAVQAGSSRLPVVICILTKHPWFLFFSKVLQVLEVLLKQSDLLSSPTPLATLPPDSAPARFLQDLHSQCSDTPELGLVVCVPLPEGRGPRGISPPRQMLTGQGVGGAPRLLRSTEQFIELEVPPNTGSGPENAGVPLARIVWPLPAAALVLLIEALLLERRVLFLSSDCNALSAAVHAAQALIHPFRWVHIFLPVLPSTLRDYLAAPMPFLIGLPSSSGLKGLAGLALEDVFVVDLDRGTVQSSSKGGGARVLAQPSLGPVPLGGAAPSPLARCALPWASELEQVVSGVHSLLLSPTETESTPLITAFMHEYLLKLFGSYRDFIEPDLANSFGGAANGVTTGEPKYVRGHGFRFDESAFLECQRSQKAAAFVQLFRHSQMYEQFLQERLQAASEGALSSLADGFERQAALLAGKSSRPLGRALASAGTKAGERMSRAFSRTTKAVKESLRSQPSSREGVEGGGSRAPSFTWKHSAASFTDKLSHRRSKSGGAEEVFHESPLRDGLRTGASPGQELKSSSLGSISEPSPARPEPPFSRIQPPPQCREEPFQPSPFATAGEAGGKSSVAAPPSLLDLDFELGGGAPYDPFAQARERMDSFFGETGHQPRPDAWAADTLSASNPSAANPSSAGNQEEGLFPSPLVEESFPGPEKRLGGPERVSGVSGVRDGEEGGLQAVAAAEPAGRQLRRLSPGPRLSASQPLDPLADLNPLQPPSRRSASLVELSAAGQPLQAVRSSPARSLESLSGQRSLSERRGSLAERRPPPEPAGPMESRPQPPQAWTPGAGQEASWEIPAAFPESQPSVPSAGGTEAAAKWDAWGSGAAASGEAAGLNSWGTGGSGPPLQMPGLSSRRSDVWGDWAAADFKALVPAAGEGDGAGRSTSLSAAPDAATGLAPIVKGVSLL